MSDRGKPNRSRPYVIAGVLVSPESGRVVEAHTGEEKYEVFGALEFSRGSLLGAILTGECHRCGAVVDHRGIAPDDEGWIPISIAVISPIDYDPSRTPPVDSEEAIAAGWGIAPICRECHLAEGLRLAQGLWSKWRQEPPGK